MWLALIASGMNIRDAESAWGLKGGRLNRLLYGDRVPDLATGLALQACLGIPTESWHQKPTRRFEPPRTLKRAA